MGNICFTIVLKDPEVILRFTWFGFGENSETREIMGFAGRRIAILQYVHGMVSVVAAAVMGSLHCPMWSQ